MTEQLPIVTTSERYAFNRCSQLWWWRYRMGLTPRGEIPDALWFGIGVHIALADWYLKGKKRGPHPAETFDVWCGDEIREIAASWADRDAEWYDAPKYEDAHTMGVAMLEAYVDKYGKDDQWNVIATEQPFHTKVLSNGQQIAYFDSTFDGVFRDEEDGQVYLMEHKTARQIQTAYLDLDPQAGAYWAVATAVLRAKKQLGPKETIAGITYNFLRKCMPDERPKDGRGQSLNKDGSVSKRQPPPAFHREIIERNPEEMRTEMEALADEVEWMNAIRAGQVPLRKNRTKDCTFCDYFAMCKLDQRGGDRWKQFADSEYTQADPYERYRLKSAGE